MAHYIAETEFGPIRAEGKDLKTLILYTFDGVPSQFLYRSVSSRANTAKNFPYFKKLATNGHTPTGLSYCATGFCIYDLKEVKENT